MARVTRWILESAGYLVRMVGSGPAALEAWAAEPADLVVTDVRMPGMSGIALAEQLRVQASGLPILFVTGHLTDELDVDDRSGRTAALMKPYTRAELLALVARLLA